MHHWRPYDILNLLHGAMKKTGIRENISTYYF